MLKRNKLILSFILIFILVLYIVFIDRWLSNNNPLATEIGNKGYSIMHLNADGKQHIAQPPQPSSNKLPDKNVLEKNSDLETKIPLIINKSNKGILQIDQDALEKNKRIIFDEMSKNIKTIDLTE